MGSTRLDLFDLPARVNFYSNEKEYMTPQLMLADRDAHTNCSRALEDIILWHVEEQGVISLDVLVFLMPEYSWSEIFDAIDRLSRSGAISLRRNCFDYTVFSIHYAA